MRNVLSVDVEQWFCRNALRGYVKEYAEDIDIPLAVRNVIEATKKILEVFKKHGKVTTFFILGEVAELVPELVRQISEEGHEIAFHGYSHRRLDELGETKFKEEVEKGINTLHRITKQEPLGFRAPWFSLNNRTAWALRVLENKGFKYDSSIFAVKTPYYGSYAAIDRPYFPSPSDLSKDDPNQKIIEFPMLIRRLWFLKIPAAGGFYLRLFGPDVIRKSIQITNKKGDPAMCYIHPWEVYGFPKISLPVHKRLYVNFRIPCLQSFEKLVKNVDIAPAIEIIEDMGI